MRIACANWSRRRAGGVESYLEFLLEGLVGLGHDVALWSESDGSPERARLDVPGDAAEWCAAVEGVDSSIAALRAWAPSVLFVHGLVEPALERRLLGIAPAVLMAHSYYGTCISGGKTLVFPSPRPCSREFGPACLAYFYPRRCGGLNPLTMVKEFRHQSDRLAVVRDYGTVLTLSGHMRREYLRHGLPSDRVQTLPRYSPRPVAPARPARPPTAGQLSLLFVGRIDRLKGCRLLIEALAGVAEATGRSVHLVVAGDGPDRSVCEDAAARASEGGHVRVTFRGWVDPAERSALLTEADVAVMPSLWPEPYGLAGLEALAAGVPLAAFASGGVPEWLRDGIDGALAPADPPTAEGLTAAIVRCLGVSRRVPTAPETIAAGQHEHLRAVEEHLGAATRIVSPAVR